MDPGFRQDDGWAAVYCPFAALAKPNGYAPSKGSKRSSISTYPALSCRIVVNSADFDEMSKKDHKVETRPFNGRVRIMTAGYLIAQSTSAVEVFETGYPTVYYIPKSDIRMAMFTPSTTSTNCPHKGQASYWHIDTGNVLIENAAWSYEQPMTAVEAITGHLAFSPEKIDAIESTSAGPA